MKLVCTSDLHGDLPDPTEMPAGDILILAGDLLPNDYRPKGIETGHTRVERQGWWFENVFVPWLSEVKHVIPEDKGAKWDRRYEKIIFTGGNHDFFLRAMLKGAIQKMLPKNVYYLHEQVAEIDGINFFGAGWNMTPGWAFYMDEDDFTEALEYMPTNLDVAIIHGPPTMTDVGGHMTSRKLADWVVKSNLKAFVCGHIHEAYGSYTLGKVPVYVVSRKNRNYRDVNPFVEITI